MEDAFDDRFEATHSLQRSTILRIYNYYRILIAFLCLFLFLYEDFGEVVGANNPSLFLNTILTYLFINIMIGLSPSFVPEAVISRPGPSFVIIVADIIALTLLISSSGGVSSGVGLFLIFTVTFAGGLIHGRISTVLPAIAFILVLYTEFYLFFLNQNEPRGFFQAGILGICFFAANAIFQYVAQILHRRETEVFTLERINKLVVERMRSGVAVVSSGGEIKLINASGKKLLFPHSNNPLATTLPNGLMENFTEFSPVEEHKTITFNVGEDSPDLLANFQRINTPSLDVDTLIFIEDSTEIQRQAQQLKLAALGRLSASIAHEIRNPLGAISHAAQLLRESPDLNTGDRRLSDIIQNHCIRMNSVIENVLRMSRRKTAEPKSLAAGKWVKDFVLEFSAGFPDKIEIEIDFVTAAEEMNFSFDPLHLSQVLGNLCQNALRYSERSIREPKLKLRMTSDAEDQNHLEVIDYGQGVPENLVPNLFEPFYTTESSGTGLGLYLSKELCEANKARLSYSLADTGGSCFKISFFQSAGDNI